MTKHTQDHKDIYSKGMLATFTPNELDVIDSSSIRESDKEDIYITADILGISVDATEDSYIGSYSSDRDFMEEMLEDDLGSIPSWVTIDWESTIESFMADYCEDNGYYFSTY